MTELMYKDLVKRLRDSEHEIDCSLCDRDCCYPDGKVHGKCIIIEAADAIEELSVVVRVQKAVLDKFPRWIPVTERLPDKFQSIFAACKSEGRENWTIDTVYDPFLECPWGRIPILETGKGVVYAWMDNSPPEPPKEE